MIAMGLWLAMTMPAGACHPIEDVRILGKDLAAADAAFAGLAPGLFVGQAPAPGVQRVMRAVELTRIARAHGLDAGSSAPLCFEWPLATLEPGQIMAAMRRSPGLASSKIELIEVDRRPAPRGEIVFPVAGLVQSSAVDTVNGVVWRGHVQYALNRKFPIWAKVKISVVTKRIIATRLLRAGDAIGVDDIRMENYEGFSFHSTAATRMEEVVGQTPRRAYHSGDVILRTLLDPVKDVKKGDTVEVKVEDGNVTFRCEARAEAAGRRGEIIPVRNLVSGKTFRAKIEAPGKVTVSPQSTAVKGSTE